MKGFIKLVLKFMLIMFVVIGIIFGAVVIYAKMSGKEITDISDQIFGETSKNPVTVLIAGLHPDGPLTDFIMVARYNPETGNVNALSIPRDTKVVGTVDGKINSAYARGKDIEKLKDKVKDVTSLSVDYYVVLDTAAVRKMVDAIGGVSMTVPMDMDYDDEEQDLHIHLKEGYQILDGDKAEQFIRFRKGNNGGGYKTGDVGRVEAQQEFIKAAVEQVLKPSTLLKLPELISLGLESVKTDFKLTDILGYIDDVKNFDKSKLRIESLPGEGLYIGNVSYFVHEPSETKALIEEMFINDTSVNTASEESKDVQNSKKTKGDITVEVLNGTSRSGLANSVAEKLKEEGYNVTKIGNYKTTTNIATSIISRTDDEDVAKEIKNFLNAGKVKTEKDSDSKVDVTVILGSDYK